MGRASYYAPLDYGYYLSRGIPPCRLHGLRCRILLVDGAERAVEAEGVVDGYRISVEGA